MLARVLVLMLGLLGGFSSGALGTYWMIGSFTHSAEIEKLRGSPDERIQKGLSRIDGMSRASYALLAAFPLGILGALLGGMGKKWLAAPILFLAVPGPLVFSFWTVVPVLCLFSACFLALFIGRPRHPADAGLMGCFNGIKGWLNIGGVKVRFQNVAPKVPKSGTVLLGKVELLAKSDRHINGINYKLLMKRSKGKGEDKEDKEKVIGETGLELDLDMKKGETQVLDFQLPYSFQKNLKDLGGVLGGVGKLAAFAMSEKDEFFLIAEAEVEGSLFEASHKLKVTMVD